MQSIKTYAPGRINIIGEHIDYNQGLVLPAAIDKGTTFHITSNGSSNNVFIEALSSGEHYQFNSDHDRIDEEGWAKYVFGVVKELQKTGSTIPGFDAEFEGNVPIGSGMSSSAALECSLAIGLNQLFDLNLTPWQLIEVCQMAEHNYVGTKCGIMDQFASMMGKENHVIKLDCGSLEYEYIPFDLDGFDLVLFDTNVKHSLATSEYNVRSEECKEGLQLLNEGKDTYTSLVDVPFEWLEQNRGNISENLYKRCHHVITENNRVQMAVKAIHKKDIHALGLLMYQSHESLQNDYAVSCRELDFLVDQTKQMSSIIGSRMMGGGFGGCTINIIQRDQVEESSDLLKKAYEQTFGIELNQYRVAIGRGAGIVTNS